MRNDIALFLYGADVTKLNRYINFTTEEGDFTAILDIGNYSYTELMFEIKKQMELAEGVNNFTWTINRTVNANRENRVTVSTTAGTLEIDFDTGVNASTSIRTLIGFDEVDYTGATSYTGVVSAGSILIPDFATYDYLPPDLNVKNDGVKNVSASGIKETLVFQQMLFIQGQWKWITDFANAGQATAWTLFLKYAIKQLKFEMTPSINEDPNLFYQVTLESTAEDGANGMAFKLNQMLGQKLYRFYETGALKFRVIPT